MKRSASLVLMELLIMLTVFAAAAALCLQAFAWSSRTSRESAAKDLAWIHGQNAAETLKYYQGDFALAAQACGGQWNGTTWDISYDAHWNVTSADAVYLLQVSCLPDEAEYLGRARLTVLDSEGLILSEFSVCWQEVTP